MYPRCDIISIHGTPLTRFWLRGRWKGGTPLDLKTFLLLALPADTYPADTPVPVRLGSTPIRRAIALIDKNNVSVSIQIYDYNQRARRNLFYVCYGRLRLLYNIAVVYYNDN